MRLLARAFRPQILLAAAAVTGLAANAAAADLLCHGLIPPGQRIICSGFEPNWAIAFSCQGTETEANFIDAFSGDGIQETPGTVTMLTENPWTFETSHPVKGTIAFTPAGCTDEGDNIHDYTFTPTAAPGLSGPFFPFCCRVLE